MPKTDSSHAQLRETAERILRGEPSTATVEWCAQWIVRLLDEMAAALPGGDAKGQVHK